jgi:hypothetical protein
MIDVDSGWRPLYRIRTGRETWQSRVIRIGTIDPR